MVSTPFSGSYSTPRFYFNISLLSLLRGCQVLFSLCIITTLMVDPII